MASLFPAAKNDDWWARQFLLRAKWSRACGDQMTTLPMTVRAGVTTSTLWCRGLSCGRSLTQRGILGQPRRLVVSKVKRETRRAASEGASPRLKHHAQTRISQMRQKSKGSFIPREKKRKKKSSPYFPGIHSHDSGGSRHSDWPFWSCRLNHMT